MMTLVLSQMKTVLDGLRMRKQTKEQPWMQAGNGPSGTRIENVTVETAEATRLEFEIRHGRNSVHMVCKEDNAMTSVVTTTPKCLMGGGGSGEDGTVYPILLPMEKVIKNHTCSTQTANHRGHR